MIASSSYVCRLYCYVFSLCNKNKVEEGKNAHKTVTSFGSTNMSVINSVLKYQFQFSFHCVPGVKRSYTFGPAGGGYEDPVQWVIKF